MQNDPEVIIAPMDGRASPRVAGDHQPFLMQISEGIHWLAVVSDFKMEMRPRGSPRLTDQGDFLSTLHIGIFGDKIFLVVRVNTDQVGAMPDDDDITVAGRSPVTEDHPARCGRTNDASLPGPNIDPVMRGPVAQAESRGNGSLDGPSKEPLFYLDCLMALAPLGP